MTSTTVIPPKTCLSIQCLPMKFISVLMAMNATITHDITVTHVLSPEVPMTPPLVRITPAKNANTTAATPLAKRYEGGSARRP